MATQAKDYEALFDDATKEKQMATTMDEQKYELKYELKQAKDLKVNDLMPYWDTLFGTRIHRILKIDRGSDCWINMSILLDGCQQGALRDVRYHQNDKITIVAPEPVRPQAPPEQQMGLGRLNARELVIGDEITYGRTWWKVTGVWLHNPDIVNPAIGWDVSVEGSHDRFNVDTIFVPDGQMIGTVRLKESAPDYQDQVKGKLHDLGVMFDKVSELIRD